MRAAACGWLALAGVLALNGCGGGTDGTGAPVGGASLTTRGVMTSGSVILNGVRFDTASARVVDDRGRTASQLADGMVVNLRGRSEDGVIGTAEHIDVENEVRGAIVSLDSSAIPPRIVVAGLPVSVDSATVFAGVASVAELRVGTRVEVHGLRDSSGLVRASRIEAVGVAGYDEVRGRIDNVDRVSRRFRLNGTVTVDYTSAAFSPVGIDASHLTDGAIVEVRGSFGSTGAFVAHHIELEGVEDAPLRGDPGERQEVEGFIAGFTAHPGAFLVGGRPVVTSAATRFRAGNASNLANDIRVEVEGTVDTNGVLIATAIEFKPWRVKLEGLATSVNPVARALVVLGQTVAVTDLTAVRSISAGGGNSTALADISAGVDCISVKAELVNGTLVADTVEEEGCSGISEVEARVTSKDASAWTLQVLGNLRAALANATFFDSDGRAMTREQFFATVQAEGPGQAGTLVEIKGIYSAGILNGTEAELED